MRKAAFGVGLLVLLAAGWSGVWLWAAHAAGDQVESWMRAEQAQGRTWTCPNRTVGGYPFALTVTCSDATYAGQALDQRIDASVAGLVAEAALLHPTRIDVTLTPPFAYRTSDGQADVKGTWSRLVVGLEGLPAIRAVSLDGGDVDVRGTFGRAGAQGGSAAAIASRFVMNPSADPTLDFDIAVKGTPIPALDALMGGAQPLDVALVGRLDRADAGGARTPEEAIDTWRRAGGRVDIARSHLVRGSASLDATGTLRLDEAHRPQGKLDADFVGLEPILKRYGISGNLAAAGSILSTLFGGGARKPPSRPGALSLPLSFNGGRLGVGPITTAVRLEPLY